jgi:hypothetical protein
MFATSLWARTLLPLAPRVAAVVFEASVFFYASSRTSTEHVYRKEGNDT